jgi:hypothetical protein
MNHEDEAVNGLIEAMDHLATAGDFDRDKLARGLAALVRRRARFEALRLRFDPRFGDVPPVRREEASGTGSSTDRRLT